MVDTGPVRTSGRSVASRVGIWRAPGTPAHRALADRLRLLILDGRLPLDTEFPGERELAGALDVSRTTVTSAYRHLREQGYLVARGRARSRTTLPAARPGVPTIDDHPPAEWIDFAHAAPEAPGQTLHAAFATALTVLPRHLARHGYAGTGLDALRDAVARRYTARGLPTRRDQILVTNGAQHAFGLVVGTLLEPGSRVVVENPTYPHALTALHAARCRLLPVPVSDDGWDLDTLRQTCDGAALAYLVPDFHNPTGNLLDDHDRARLQLGCPVVVDETMADLALDTPPARPMAAHHRDVVSIGSVSKTFWGGLRIGWIRAEPRLLARIDRHRPAVDLGSPVFEQLAAATLLDDIDSLLPQRQQQLRRRREHLISEIERLLPDWRVRRPSGGLAVWTRLPQPYSSALATHCRDFGLLLAAGPAFGARGEVFENRLRLPYTHDTDTLTAGITSIATCLAERNLRAPQNSTTRTPLA